MNNITRNIKTAFHRRRKSVVLEDLFPHSEVLKRFSFQIEKRKNSNENNTNSSNNPTSNYLHNENPNSVLNDIEHSFTKYKGKF